MRLLRLLSFLRLLRLLSPPFSFVSFFLLSHISLLSGSREIIERLRYKTHRQELGTINQDVVHTNSPQRHDTYVYYFADGSRSTLVLGADDTSCVNGAWIAELRELDRLEYNNQHTQTRRHCSLDAQDPEGMGGYYTGDDMERVQLELEVEDFLTSLPKDLEQIARLLCEGFSAAEIARKQGVNRSSICRKIKKIQDAMMHYNP